MLTIFQNAIRNKQCLLIDYEPGLRVIEPHAIGYGSDGQLLVRAFQTEGVSASGEHTNWKLLRVDRLKAANDNGTTFEGPRDGYRRGDKVMKRGIIEQL